QQQQQQQQAAAAARTPNVDEESEIEIMRRIAYFNVIANGFITLLQNLCELVPKSLLRSDFAPRIAVLCGTYINQLANPERMQLVNIKNRNRTGFSPKALLSSLVRMLANLSFYPSASVANIAKNAYHVMYP